MNGIPGSYGVASFDPLGIGEPLPRSMSLDAPAGQDVPLVERLQALLDVTGSATNSRAPEELFTRLAAELRRLAREPDRLRLLLDVPHAIRTNLESRPLFTAIAKCLRRVIAHDYTSLGVYDAERNAFEMTALEFVGKGLIKEHMPVPVEGAPAGRAITTGAPARFDRAGLEAL